MAFVLPAEPLAETLTFHVKRLAAEQRICVDNLRAEVRQDDIFHAVAVRLVMDVATFDGATLEYHELVNGDVTRIPLDWKEAVKERFAPRWARQRWPVRYRETRLVTQQAMGYLPGFPVSSARFGVVKAAWLRSNRES